MKLSCELEQFLESIKEIVKQIPPKPKEEKYVFKYKKQAKEETKEIIKNAIKNGKARVEFQQVEYYDITTIIGTTHVLLICEDALYGTIGFSLEPLFEKKFITKPEQLSDKDIEELVEKIDIDFALEYCFAPKHPFRQKYKKLKEQEWKEHEKFKEEQKAKIKQWEQKNKEKLEKIMELYNNLSEDAKNELRYLIDPYDGLYGLDPTIEHLIELVEQLYTNIKVNKTEKSVKCAKIEETTLVNLTPHSITVFIDDNSKLEIPPSGITTRAKSSQETVKHIGNIPVKATVFSEVENLPEPSENTVFIVSSLVLQALKARGIKRDDLVAPDTSPQSAVRDENGRIIGVRRFQVF